MTTGTSAPTGRAASIIRFDATGALVSQSILFVLPSGRAPPATSSVANKTATTSRGCPSVQGIVPAPTLPHVGMPAPVITCVPPHPELPEYGREVCTPRDECNPLPGVAPAQPTTTKPTQAAARRPPNQPFMDPNRVRCIPLLLLHPDGSATHDQPFLGSWRKDVNRPHSVAKYDHVRLSGPCFVVHL